MPDYIRATFVLEALLSIGISQLSSILEAISKRRADSIKDLRIITIPNEFPGLCAAQGFFQATEQIQAVLIQVDAGTLGFTMCRGLKSQS